MGSFDYIEFECPVCSDEILEQSKAGSCDFNIFHSSEVPLEIAADIQGEVVKCIECGCSFEIKAPNLTPTIQMVLIERKE